MRASSRSESQTDGTTVAGTGLRGILEARVGLSRSYSHKRYEFSIFPSGESFGPPEDAFAASAMYL